MNVAGLILRMTAGSGRSSGDRRGRRLYECHVKHDIKRGRYECT